MLHRVLDTDSAGQTCSQPEIVVLKQTFDRMVRYLTSEFDVVTLPECRNVFAVDATRPRVLVTFDDGWTDNYTSAFPVANEAGLRFTIFICPDLMDRNLPFWPERVVAGLRAVNPRISNATLSESIEQLKTLPVSERERRITELPYCGTNPVDATFGWNAAVEMQQGCVTFGSHTATHQMLPRISQSEAERELVESRFALRARLGGDCESLAYPNGDVSISVRDLAAQAGYRLAFTTKPGVWTDSTDALQIPRININEAKVTDVMGRFSPAMFDYSVVWKALRTGL
jgi:peptidoglycan/xylan/chitin deacetylase (PgdA/CDA1 family)